MVIISAADVYRNGLRVVTEAVKSAWPTVKTRLPLAAAAVPTGLMLLPLFKRNDGMPSIMAAKNMAAKTVIHGR
jgi:hypothetical protein